eukprot:TRINITY_DN22627_c0_g1_i2.p1 TRINITY_DN22627_c0_g1~~TRINITY_DN22627_c0_g1_i2.p1  ORF type:complete len:378 (+),score=60.89 TRINITY_DN22627_c0_g1_i2:81-1214(+)
MIRRPPRSTLSSSSAASDVYKRQVQLQGAVGYTGFIRPSLQCTQQSTLKPGQHGSEMGSYFPRRPPSMAMTIQTSPASLTKDMSSLVSPDPYKNHSRQDRVAGDLVATTPRGCSHWKSIGAEAFRVHTPPESMEDFAQAERVQHAVLPSPESGKVATQPSPNWKTQVTQPSPGATQHRSPRRRHQGPREGSREYLVARQDHVSRAAVDGTTTISQVPAGYMGHVPHVLTNSPKACEQGMRRDPRISQRCKEDTLFDSFNERPIGYQGYAPTTVYNRRTWSPHTRSTAGATDIAMMNMGYSLKRPEAGGESAILSSFFAGPLEGRPSDNGNFNAQVFYSHVRPFEGAPRSHWPSSCHPSGRKFAQPAVTVKNWGNTKM